MELLSFFDQLSVFEMIIGIVFIFSVITQILYYSILFSKLAFYKKEAKKNIDIEPVSIIISAHDEDYNLKENLPAILNQDYPDYEVVVVNHASSDDTKEVLQDFQRQSSRLKIVNIYEDLNFFKGKKFPLSIGIKSAKNDLLLLTDADCKPSSDKWIERMVRNYKSNTEVVLGYGPYTKTKGLLNLIIRYDTFMIAMQYFSFALAGIPYMGVGRNLSYRRSLFMKNKGFTSHYNISSGDDDLYIMQVATKSNTRIEVNPESFVFSDAKPTFRSWIQQKQRHFTTGKEYSLIFKILLGALSSTLLLFYTSFILLLISNTLILATLATFILVMAFKVFIQKKAADKLGENQLLLFSLIGDIFYIIIMSAMTLTSIFRKQGDWK